MGVGRFIVPGWPNAKSWFAVPVCDFGIFGTVFPILLANLTINVYI
jgi:hypothetical protein